MSRHSQAMRSSQWQALRLVVLGQAGWRCEVGDPGCLGEATTVDHAVPLADGGAMWDRRNLRAACSRCNYGRGSRLAHDRRQGWHTYRTPEPHTETRF